MFIPSRFLAIHFSRSFPDWFYHALKIPSWLAEGMAFHFPPTALNPNPTLNPPSYPANAQLVPKELPFKEACCFNCMICISKPPHRKINTMPPSRIACSLLLLWVSAR